MYLIDKRTKESFELQDGAVIGRDSASDFVIDDRTVSRAHAQVEVTPDGVVLRDLGSSRGTFCGRDRVESIALRPGMKITLGGARFEVVDDVPFETLDPRVDPLSKLDFRPAHEVWEPIELQNNYERLRVVYELNRALGVERELDPVITKILQTAFELLSAERGVVRLFESSGYPKVIASTRFGPVVDLALSQTVVDEVVRDRKGIIIADAQLHARFSRAASIAVEGVRSVMCVPLLFEDEVLGVIQVDSLRASHAFGSRDLALFSTIASQAAVIIKERILRQEVMSAQEGARLRLQRILDQLPCGVFLLDKENQVQLSNPAADEIANQLKLSTQGPFKQLGGTDLETIFSANESPVEIDIEDQQGARFHVRASVGAEETVLVVEDVTELHARRVREARTERLSLVGHVAAGLARDFHALVDAVFEGANTVRAATDDEGIQRVLSTMEDAARNASDIFEELLPFQRASEEDEAALVLDEQVRFHLESLGSLFPPTLHLEMDLNAGDWCASLKPSHLEGVLKNLIYNARDATSGVGRIVVRTMQFRVQDQASQGYGQLSPGDYLQLEVEDNGVGMSDEVRLKLFDPLFSTKGGKGSGLGLTTVLGIVESNKGQISVVSSYGEGSTFIVLLPRAQEFVRTVAQLEFI